VVKLVDIRKRKSPPQTPRLKFFYRRKKEEKDSGWIKQRHRLHKEVDIEVRMAVYLQYSILGNKSNKNNKLLKNNKTTKSK